MSGHSGATTDAAVPQIEGFPDSFTTGTTVLLACAGDPAQHAVGLRALCRFGESGDAALVVTTTGSAEETRETYDRLCAASERPSLQLVDTTAARPSVSGLYGESATVHIPSPGDLERLVLGLSELSADGPPANGARHLVVRSLTPILEAAAPNRVRTVLDRITGLRVGRGLGLLGIDYTAHDEETMTALSRTVDGILWITGQPDGPLELSYRSTSGRYRRSASSDAEDASRSETPR